MIQNKYRKQIEKIRSKNQNTKLSTYSGNGVLQSTHLTKIASSQFGKGQIEYEENIGGIYTN